MRSVTEALADPQLAAREMIVPLEHVTAGPIRVLGTPLKLSETPATIRTPPPTLGQHTAAILAEDCRTRVGRDRGASSALDETGTQLVEQHADDVLSVELARYGERPLAKRRARA